ncbi:MAG: hypothetical protein WC217_02435 [Candidatus Paceibacterota bacterium]|jgi:hypothetical protein
MKCVCGIIPLAVNNIERIEQYVAKLRKAVVDGLYDERSIVGDAVLSIEGQLRQLRDVLDMELRFNDVHPELRSDEMFLCNVVPHTSDWKNIPYKTKRLGNQAYDTAGKPIALAPVFVKVAELQDGTETSRQK